MQGEVKRFFGFISTNTDPYYNITLENFFLRERSEPILFLWQSTPAIVMGRFQNPWLESNMPKALEHKIKYVRRFSGGGTVYQDLGNLNFCFIDQKANYNKKKNCELIASALRELKIEAKVNPRFDLTVNDRKISGSAFKETKDRCLHHGTILVEANLNMIKEVLHHKQLDITSKSIKSVRSPVINLKDVQPKLSVEIVRKKLIEMYFTNKLQFEVPKNFEQDYRSYTSDEWIFRETPIFELKRDGKVFLVEKGEIVKVKENDGNWTLLEKPQTLQRNM